MTDEKEFSEAELAEVSALLDGDEAEVEPITPDLVTPSGLSPAGADLWMRVASTYVLRVDDMAVLTMAAKAQTTLDAVEAKWAEEGFPMIGEGYNGQPVEHPLLTMADKQRKTIAQLLRQLRLPDLETGVSPFSHAGRGQAGGLQRGANERRKHRGRRVAGD